jgi:hypothetical protein
MDNVPIHRFRNNTRAIPVADKGWQSVYDHGALDLNVTHLGDDRYQEVGPPHRKFVNFCSCSYLGLTYHPKVLEGAHEALRSEQILTLSMSRARIRSRLHDELEQSLSELYRARCIATVTTSACVLTPREIRKGWLSAKLSCCAWRVRDIAIRRGSPRLRTQSDRCKAGRAGRRAAHTKHVPRPGPSPKC